MKRTAVLGALMTVGVLSIVLAAAQTPSASLLQVDKSETTSTSKSSGANSIS